LLLSGNVKTMTLSLCGRPAAHVIRMLAIARARNLPLRPALAVAGDHDGPRSLRRLAAAIPEDGEDVVLDRLQDALAAGVDRPAAGMLAALREIGVPAGGLRRLAEWLGARAAQRHHFYRAVGYPFSLMLAAALVYTVLFQAFVMPILAELFSPMLELMRPMDSALPRLTELVIGFYTTPGSFWLSPLSGALYCIVVLAFCIATLYFGARLHSFRLALYIPFMRQYLRFDAARSFSQTLALLLSYRVPAPAAIRLAADTISNRWLRRRLLEVADQVERGEGLGECLRETRALPPSVAWRIWSAYYRSGLEQELVAVAASCEQELLGWELKIKSSMRVIPIVIAAVALLPVLLAVVAMYLPLFVSAYVY
jgi:type II secretory pathway component PulF